MSKYLNCFSVSQPYSFRFKKLGEVEYEESFMIVVNGGKYENLNDDVLFKHASKIAIPLYLKEIRSREHELRYYYYYCYIVVDYVSLGKKIRFYSDEHGLDGCVVGGKQYYGIISSPVKM